MPAYGFASFADRERDVRDAAARWADRGLAVRFGVEVTYERRYEDEIRGWLRRHPHDYVIGSVHISARSPYKAGDVAVVRRRAGRWPRSSQPYFDEVVGAARSGLFDTIGHLDFVKRYLVPHVHARRPRRRARAVRAASCAALVEGGTALEVNASGLRQLPRETYPSAAIVAPLSRARRPARDDRLGCAPNGVVLHMGCGEAYRHATGAGFEALAFRRGGERRARAAASEHRDVASGLTRGSTVRYDGRRRGGRASRGSGAGPVTRRHSGRSSTATTGRSTATSPAASAARATRRTWRSSSSSRPWRRSRDTNRGASPSGAGCSGWPGMS